MLLLGGPRVPVRIVDDGPDGSFVSLVGRLPCGVTAFVVGALEHSARSVVRRHTPVRGGMCQKKGSEGGGGIFPVLAIEDTHLSRS